MTVVVAAPLAARADIILEGSAGSGYNFAPSEAKSRTPTSLMIAPGFSFPFVRLQLGFDGVLGDVDSYESTIRYRPMITISPPVIPLYGRVIFAVTHPFDGDTRTLQYGGALGLSFGLPVVVASIHVFGELGLLPYSQNDHVFWVGEARAGV